ncbi:MAG: Asp-tRNA(Asn)/Glu-tRNA(Gln) amidotransferase subunit GatC [Planctomycetes bacterium]|nr:Asp-tRNA(Asn)/Glu-tRNA(Gln) amidotransferase subunit GatC [Planctomycetota bacterium]
MSLSLQDVSKVGLLARLALTEAEVERMTGELSKIVEFVSQLSALDTATVEPLAHPLETRNVFREDEPQPSLTPEQALSNSPNHDGACFLVPAVLGESGAA